MMKLAPDREVQVGGEDQHMRTGSLPFKKRRFPRLALSVIRGETNQACEASAARTASSTDIELNATSEEKIAALALVAAATAPSPAVISKKDTRTVAPKTHHGFSLYEGPTSADIPTTIQDTSADNEVVAEKLDSDATAGKKSHRPPLTSPLPHGCHGRTSRNNSFCRRQPYNGSKFCKSHYLSLIVSGVATDQELRSGQVVTTGVASGGASDGTVSESLDGANALAIVVQNQDKRYTGGDMEIRCKGRYDQSMINDLFPSVESDKTHSAYFLLSNHHTGSGLCILRSEWNQVLPHACYI